MRGDEVQSQKNQPANNGSGRGACAIGGGRRGSISLPSCAGFIAPQCPLPRKSPGGRRGPRGKAEIAILRTFISFIWLPMLGWPSRVPHIYRGWQMYLPAPAGELSCDGDRAGREVSCDYL